MRPGKAPCKERGDSKASISKGDISYKDQRLPFGNSLCFQAYGAQRKDNFREDRSVRISD